MAHRQARRECKELYLLGPKMTLQLPLDYAAIGRILPHRYPFLLVDRVIDFEPDRRIVGIKNVSANERYLSRVGGERPAMPPTRSGAWGNPSKQAVVGQVSKVCTTRSISRLGRSSLLMVMKSTL